ncbi:MAG TPA: S1 RNA-binding domain-containing protein, partial [Nitrospinota bacterium]|nr:S1 RNA-binding domain-containing protein [Nitrospinota bacterium]
MPRDKDGEGVEQVKRRSRKKDTQNMNELYEKSFERIKEGDIVKGKIIQFEKDVALVDIGYKSEGYISLNEFPGSGVDLKVGDEVEVLLETTEDKDGRVVLSKERADKIKIWDELE